MDRAHTPALPAYLALVAGVVILGFSAIFVSLADAPGTVTAFYRMAIGSAVMAVPFVARRARRATVIPKRGALLAALAGVFFGTDVALWMTGITMGNATSPTLLGNTAPLWVGLGALLIFRERQGKLFWSGLVVALVGAALVLGKDLSLATRVGIGTLLGLVASFFYAGYMLVTQRGRVHVDTLSYLWIWTTAAAAVLLVANLALGRPLVGYAPGTWLAFAAGGVVVQVLGWLVITYAQGYIPASIASPTLVGQPVLTAVFAALFLGESLTVLHGVGGVAVLAGILMVHRSRRARPGPAAPGGPRGAGPSR